MSVPCLRRLVEAGYELVMSVPCLWSLDEKDDLF